ncbi:alpha/beta hydrolase [soil metagenome]
MRVLIESEILARLDPEFVGRFDATLPPHLPEGELTVERVRAVDAAVAVLPDATAERHELARSDGSTLELRVHGAPASAAILWIHGGGMFLGSARSEDARCRELTQTLGVSTAAVDYRLAPEHGHPEPLEDCFAALEWLAERYDRVVVAGASAGGGLALGLALLARDRGRSTIAGVQAWYPMLDDRSLTDSVNELVHAPVWNRRLHDLGWAAYLGDREADAYGAPSRALDLTGLPPTYIEVGELDLFRDEDADFAGRLAAAGVPVEFHLDPGAVHAFDIINPDAALSRAAMARRVAWLATALAESPRKDDGRP